VARTAEQAGVTADRMRAAAGRLRPGRPAPAPPKRRRWLGIGIGVAIAALVLAGLFFGARQIHFLGTDEGGRIALYRGLPYDLPLGINLYSEQESIPVQLTALTPERQEVVTEHKLRSESDAADILEDIDSREGAQPPVPPATQQQPAPAAPKRNGKAGRKKSKGR
jgi:hypothetical protein